MRITFISEISSKCIIENNLKTSAKKKSKKKNKHRHSGWERQGDLDT